jgi:hypothetical protein
MNLDVKFILEWNRKFPLDKWWRDKYNIPLFSSKHLEISQIDVTLEFFETVLIQRAEQELEEEKKSKKDYIQGMWIQPKEGLSQTDDQLFDKIDLRELNKK